MFGQNQSSSHKDYGAAQWLIGLQVLSMESLHVLPVDVWVFFWHSGFLPRKQKHALHIYWLVKVSLTVHVGAGKSFNEVCGYVGPRFSEHR